MRAERRSSTRKEVLETFSVFLVIPRLGLRKLYLKDVSEGGLGFYAEKNDQFDSGEELEALFYINPGLKLPLKLKVAHVTGGGEAPLKIGCQFGETSSRAYKAFSAFLKLLDELRAFTD